ncbi:hypothetical protein FOZ62_030561 [Perkinsus olseni]|uniref:Immunoglobulin super DCC subclass member n=1 Tax=Perkinsus olseni TaxID=32597 RepID=A0A7J6QQZ9_PEROL|nr:hypothetical protein FOZ62_030561 [Perkinsus olseni]
MKFAAVTTAATLSVALAGQCTSEDQAFWTSYGQTFSNFLAGCGKQAWGDAKGTTKCLVDDPMNKLTPSCAQCFGDSVQCGRGSCMFSCIAGPATSKCLKCIHNSQCDDKLYACTGYPATEMPPDPTGTVSSLPVTTAAPTTTTSTTTTTTPSTTTTTTTPSTTTTTTTPSTTTTTTTPSTTTTTTTPSTTTTTTTPSTTTTTTTPSTTTTTTTPSTTTTTTTPSTTATTTTSSTTATTTTSSTTTTATTTTSVVTQGSCSAGDHNLWTSYGPAYSNFIAYCGLESFGDAKATTACIEKSGLSDSCSACFGQSVQCGRDVCMMSCIAGPATEKCLSCISKTKCNPDLYKCTGYGPNEMPPNPTGTDPLPNTTSAPSTSTTTTTVAPTTKSTTTTSTTVAPTTKSTSTTVAPTTKSTSTTSTTVAPTTTESTSTTVAPTTESTTSTTVTPSTMATSTKATPTQEDDCSEADKVCAQSYAGSYCKYWMDEPTCFGSDIPCSCKAVVTTTPSVAKCDAECAAEFPGSYCKYWEEPSVCFGSNKPCSC